MRLTLVIVLLQIVATLATAAELSGDVVGQIDYVDRGLSLSGEDPSVGGGLYLDYGAGFYAGVTAARVKDLRGNDALLGGVIGRSLGFDAYELDLSVALDGFIGGDDFLYPEVKARLSRDLGLLKAFVGLAYAPDGRWAVRNEQTLYGYFETEAPVPRLPWLTLTGHVGYEAITDAPDKTDWGLGLAAGYKALEFSLGYEDSDRDIKIGKARFVAAVRLFF